MRFRKYRGLLYEISVFIFMCIVWSFVLVLDIPINFTTFVIVLGIAYTVDTIAKLIVKHRSKKE
ncbi:hypothetical protein OEV98_05985 [Caldibacillus lycopersici]|uniref:Uncharacterized protein n=1 Tax=Perspicuibacillus lycopersici TaxID=1325689 RepID=A0AAE3ITD3_9BACI|nr:hypothetical protein [Perspicuibacillus lycopersici]MCU9613099.1 hypothetical protein [Perspicuibacillus lycopersici]